MWGGRAWLWRPVCEALRLAKISVHFYGWWRPIVPSTTPCSDFGHSPRFIQFTPQAHCAATLLAALCLWLHRQCAIARRQRIACVRMCCAFLQLASVDIWPPLPSVPISLQEPRNKGGEDFQEPGNRAGEEVQEPQCHVW